MSPEPETTSGIKTLEIECHTFQSAASFFANIDCKFAVIESYSVAELAPATNMAANILSACLAEGLNMGLGGFGGFGFKPQYGFGKEPD